MNETITNACGLSSSMEFLGVVFLTLLSIAIVAWIAWVTFSTLRNNAYIEEELENEEENDK